MTEESRARFPLETEGHIVEAFASSAEFLKSGARHFACLISDNRMQPVSGLELIKRLRADGVGIPILLLTASPSPRVLEKPARARDPLEYIDSKLSR